MNDGLAYSTIADVGARLRSGEVTSVGLTELMLQRIADLDGILNAFVTVTGDAALVQAGEADRDLAEGRDRGPLHGIPVALKDLFATRGILTTAGSRLFADWIPDEDATVVTRLRDAGAVVLGKTSMHELAFGYTSINPFYGPIANPWDLTRHPGGSSGGSAVAVAAGMAYAALGTDTACSVRQPAHCCGVVGHKPTFGLVSKHGVLPLAWSLDHVGVFTRSVMDAGVVLDTIAGPDPADPYSIGVEVADLPRPAGESVEGVRVGVPRGLMFEGGDAEVSDLVDRALAVLADLGAEVVEIEIPDVEEAANAFRVAGTVEILAVHGDDLAARPEMFSEHLKQRLTRFEVDAVTYARVQDFRRRFAHSLDRIMTDTPILAAPTSVIPAGSIADPSPPDGHLNSRNTSIFNMTGQPSVSVPCGFTGDGLPVGLMLSGRELADHRVLALAGAYEQATTWRSRRPPHG